MVVKERVPTKIRRRLLQRLRPGLRPRRITPTPKIAPISEDGKRVSKEIYWAEYYEHPDFVYEWNNGILEVKPMAKINHSDMYRWMLCLLESYLRVYPIATLIMLEIGFEVPIKNGERVRIPDLGVVCNDNPIPADPEDHSYTGTFDLCIESLSDSNSRQIKRDVDDKRQEYAQGGVKEYYILDDQRNRHMNFFYLTASGSYQPIPPTAEGVICSSALPDFQFRIEDLYRQLSLTQLVDDPIYERFIWPEYRLEKERADLAEQQARSYEAKLRELGIDPSTLLT